MKIVAKSNRYSVSSWNWNRSRLRGTIEAICPPGFEFFRIVMTSIRSVHVHSVPSRVRTVPSLSAWKFWKIWDDLSRRATGFDRAGTGRRRDRIQLPVRVEIISNFSKFSCTRDGTVHTLDGTEYNHCFVALILIWSIFIAEYLHLSCHTRWRYISCFWTRPGVKNLAVTCRSNIYGCVMQPIERVTCFGWWRFFVLNPQCHRRYNTIPLTPWSLRRGRVSPNLYAYFGRWLKIYACVRSCYVRVLSDCSRRPPWCDWKLKLCPAVMFKFNIGENSLPLRALTVLKNDVVVFSIR